MSPEYAKLRKELKDLNSIIIVEIKDVSEKKSHDFCISHKCGTVSSLGNREAVFRNNVVSIHRKES